MQDSYGFLFAFMLFAMMITIVYFSFFSKSQEKFVFYWGYSWIFYSLGLLCLIISKDMSSLPLLEARKILDLLNILYLLYGAYAFMHISIPGYWLKFSLYLMVWMALAVAYDFDLNLAYLPISIYQVMLTIVLCYEIIKNWDIERKEKALSLIIFLSWDLSKATFSYFETGGLHMESIYLIEVLMSNTLNFCILLIYLAKMKKDFFVKDKLFRIMAENATDIIFYYQLSPFPCFSYISPSIEKITGYAPNEFYNNPKLHIEISHFDDQITAISLFSGDDAAPVETENYIQHKMVRWYTKEGAMIWMEFHNSAIYENDSLIAVDGIIRDVSGRKKVEDSLQSSKKSMESFLSYISHELKTPMTSILGYITALKDGTIVDDKKKRDAIDLIHSKSLTLQRLTDDLYELSQMETKQFDFKFMQLSAGDFLNNLVHKYSWDVKNMGLKFYPNANANAFSNIKCDIIADNERLEQVFSNILYNAIKFTEPAGTISVSCHVDDKQKMITISISDTGIGIPLAEQENIFEKFYRSVNSEPVNGKKGSGLGLALSKEIISAHNGRIWVSSTVGKGSTFNFALPIYKE
jgi:PAS domain S-box-containing protein